MRYVKNVYINCQTVSKNVTKVIWSYINTVMMTDFSSILKTYASDVDQALDKHLPSVDQRPSILHEAMRYAVFAGGKRLRPILCLITCDVLGGTRGTAILPAISLETLHTYTLIHDDLPAMDDDDLRRGKPTCHKAFGEANAILAGDALLTLSFEWLSQSNPAGTLVYELATATGSMGVVGGQVEDLASEGKPVSAEQVDYIHRHKTGDLIRASVRMGAICADADAETLQALTDYAECIGLAFQIADDILNETSTEEMLGKAVGSDQEKNKMTYVAVYGLEQAKEKAQSLIDQACRILQSLPCETEPLEQLARYIVERTY